jgi:acetylornithine deacetylase
MLGATTMNIGVIEGGVAANVIPAHAEAELMFRVVTSTSSLKRLIEDVVGSRVDLEYTFECDPVFTQPIGGIQTTVVSFTTDIPMLTNWGKPLLFGPGSILDAHTDGEKISKEDLLAAVETYKEMVVRLKAEES